MLIAALAVGSHGALGKRLVLFRAVVTLHVVNPRDVFGKVYDHTDRLVGTGTATTMGKLKVTIDEHAYSRNELWSHCNQFVADGFFTARAGSMQFIYLHTNCRDPKGGRDFDHGTFIVIGGTTKLASAFGSGTFSGRSDTGPTGVANWTFNGKVTFPVG
jgi:hypothetical protein